MKLYIIRHGESENYKKGSYTGWGQVDLTESGIEQAKSLAPTLSKVKFDRVFSSDLSRAQKTAENALPEYEYESTPLLREVNVGSLSGVETVSFTKEIRDQIATNGFAAFGGESYDEFYARVNEFLDMVKSLDANNVAAFAHAGFLRGALEAVLGVRLGSKRIICANCAIAIFELVRGEWMLHTWQNTQ